MGIGLLAAAPGSIWYLYARRAHESTDHRAERVPSIAVLPFVNLSSDKEQEHFSDGIAEEILNELAQVNGLRVIGRTSSFSMKGKSEDLRAIGEKLDAANLLEGSERKSGPRVRITAQLIEAQRGSHRAIRLRRSTPLCRASAQDEPPGRLSAFKSRSKRHPRVSDRVDSTLKLARLIWSTRR
jgi:TolB-like protein